MITALCFVPLLQPPQRGCVGCTLLTSMHLMTFRTAASITPRAIRFASIKDISAMAVFNIKL